MHTRNYASGQLVIQLVIFAGFCCDATSRSLPFLREKDSQIVISVLQLAWIQNVSQRVPQNNHYLGSLLASSIHVVQAFKPFESCIPRDSSMSNGQDSNISGSSLASMDWQIVSKGHLSWLGGWSDLSLVSHFPRGLSVIFHSLWYGLKHFDKSNNYSSDLWKRVIRNHYNGIHQAIMFNNADCLNTSQGQE